MEFASDSASDLQLKQDEEIEKNYSDSPPEYVKLWFSKRYFIGAMLFLGYMHENPMRAALSISIVEMTSNKTIWDGNQTIYYDPEYDWDSRKKGLALSMYSYGAFFSIFTVHLVRKLGGSTAFGISQIMKGLLSTVSPYILDLNFNLFLLCEFLKGLFGDALHCSTPEIWSKWAPKNEQSKLMALTFSGLYLGALIAYPLCGLVAFTWGWRSTFYLTGIAAIVWSVLWGISVTNEPSTDPRISKKERLYIEYKLKETSKKQEHYSWKRILSLIPVWMMFLVSTTYAIELVLIFTYFPMYIKDTTQRDIKEVGMLSGAPNIANVILLPVIGYAVDYIQNKNILTTTQVHKLLMCSGFTFGALLLISTSTFSQFSGSLICLTLFRVTMSVEFISLKLLPACVAPQFPSIIQSFVSFGFSLGSVTGTLFVGFIVTHHSLVEWNICFTTISFALIICAVAFLLFGSAEIQILSNSPTSDVEGEIEIMKSEELDDVKT